MNLAVFFLSIAPAFLILAILFINQPKIFQKDLGIYILKLLLCSIITLRIALFANGVLMNQTDLSFAVLDESVFIYTAFAGIGFNEEMAKLVPILFLLYLSDRWKSKQDVYFSCIFVGAFFAAFENLFVPVYSSSLSHLVIRSLIAVPAHLSFACLMGYFINLLMKCSVKEGYAEKNVKIGAISWFLQIVIFIKFAIFFLDAEFKSSPLEAKIFTILSIGFILVLIVELILLSFDFKRFKWILGWNLRMSYALFALIIPSLLHGLHDWGCSRFTGTQLLHFYLSLVFTYITIIFFTYYKLNKQAQVDLQFKTVVA
jgi:RsiW-degrading membrane proteinase PrsW (M82 family)